MNKVIDHEWRVLVLRAAEKRERLSRTSSELEALCTVLGQLPSGFPTHIQEQMLCRSTDLASDLGRMRKELAEIDSRTAERLAELAPMSAEETKQAADGVVVALGHAAE